MEKLYFNCNSCGRCCNTPPTFLFSDFMKYSKDFIIAMKIINYKRITNKSHANSESLVKLNNRLYPLLNNNHIICFPFGVNTGSECTQLLDNKQCGIYERRPDRCKVVPFSMTTPEDMYQQASFDLFFEQECLSLVEKENFIKIFDNNKIIEPTMKKHLEEERKQFENSKIEVLTYLNYLKKNKVNIRRGINEISIVTYLEMLYDFKRIDPEKILSFLKDQQELMETQKEKCPNPYDTELIIHLSEINKGFALEKFNIEI